MTGPADYARFWKTGRLLRHRATAGPVALTEGLYKSNPSVAVRVVPLYLAEIVDEVERSTIDVLTVKLALLAPAGINTLPGTLAAPLLLERLTCTPPAGAGALKNTVPLEDCKPPMTLVGLSVNEVSVGTGRGAGFTEREADRIAPP